MNDATISVDDRLWMGRALELARQGETLGEVPVGAVLVRDGEVLGEGFNAPISLHDPSAHAEIQALRAAALSTANYRLPNSTLYVTIEPCTMCAGALVHARVARLIFGAPEPRAGAVLSNLAALDRPGLNHRVSWLGGVREAECATLLQSFFAGRR